MEYITKPKVGVWQLSKSEQIRLWYNNYGKLTHSDYHS